MKALVTGASGFVGKYLLEHLLENELHIVATKLKENSVVLKDPNITWIDLNILDEIDVMQKIRLHKPDYIFHLAGQSSVKLSWDNIGNTLNTNIIGSLNILESVRVTGLQCRVILIGSSEEYGIYPVNRMPLKEDYNTNPRSPYAISKMTQELLGKLYFNSFNINNVMVRAFNHIGPGQDTRFVVADFSKQIIEIEKGLKAPTITVGNIDVERDFTDVRDVVRAYYSLSKCGKGGEIYNVCSGIPIKISEILKQLISLSTYKGIIEISIDSNKYRKNDMMKLYGSNEKLNKATGWERKYSNIKESLNDILNYWRKEHGIL
ncbi:GDP-mannose 4,6-dehydratase [Vallitalea okinawensis]|uniref:GDP-mannose 4,6-dehydratase n=1 Tax=Vallitalea okinawensis TaxID=2078660 RepID=UPI001300A955|nr:GDP-mannose 4,6-dehydratase [Vallitalea okinawensis]